MNDPRTHERGGNRAPRPAFRVLIAGGGVAALEAALALRKLTEDRVEIELLAPEPHFWYRPLAVAELFGAGHVHGLALASLARACGAQFTLGALASVDADNHVARTAAGADFDYDALLVATGASPVPAVAGALTFRGPANNLAFLDVLAELEAGAVRSLAFAVPGGVTWPLPLYELALLTSSFLEDRGIADVDLALVTPEDGPLALFGAQASAAVRRLLEDRHVAVHTRRFPMIAEEGALVVAPNERIDADRVVALPRLQGRPIDGVPRDANGFVPVDRHGFVTGIGDVLAAGDVTAFPVKQGGIAAQQATAAAEAIAAAAGADVVPHPFRPVLRGLLLTGAAPTYLRAEIVGGAGDTSTASSDPLWWPPGKIVGQHLAPFLAERAGAVFAPPEGADALGVEVDLGSAAPS